MARYFYDKDEVIPRMRGMWKAALIKLCNASPSFFSGKHQPCLYCGGKDRARWTDNLNQAGDGGNICNQCGNDSGIGLFMRLRGESYSEAINTLGDWLSLIPVEVITKANKQASRTPALKTGNYCDHDKCEAVMKRTIAVDNTPLTDFEGISCIDDKFLVGERIKGDAKELIHAVPCYMVNEDGVDDYMCNVMFINQSGSVSFLAKRYSFGAVAVIGGGKTGSIYLCTDWVNGVHTHISTGQEVWVCFTPENIESVAFKYRGGRNVRVACKRIDVDTLYAADERCLPVLFPINDNYKMGLERKLYNASDFV